ncbi:MAG TPA: UDP-N-acetylmuramoyl-L-alanyl-D-glutamate--2,6-diaminopimelate ligase [Bryobacteraceae bacterium]|nr:UDP-N-acetylmuramoyl-L-alanyl-D-glutamate--2,6-diaminopimelate ligase [Bryobacteraceae bacterium]
MTTLAQVLNGVRLRGGLRSEWANLTVAGLEYDSRRVERDFVFFAFPGSRVDGRAFAQDAIARGGCAIVSESPRPAEFAGPWIEVEHGRHALALCSRNFYATPDDRIAFTGVTGTNGKTTTTYLIDAMLRAAGKTTAMIGTIEYRMAGEMRPAPNTTPEALDVMRLAAELEELGGSHLTMEVSSHALALGRVYGFGFHTAVFTNLTRDHLDFHGTMEEYAAAKRLLFQPPDQPGPRWTILNADDPASVQMARSGGARVVQYGLRKSADLRAENVRSSAAGLAFDAVYQGERHAISSPLVGGINVSNILAALGTGVSYDLPLSEAARGVAMCTAVPGRFERVDEGQPFLAVVDYAHTDDALRNAIQIARELATGGVITLFGCGGDRDRTKRPLMGMAAAELSDFVLLTSDNPRSEDPLDIMNDAMVGLSRFDTPHIAEPDRERAIRKALEMARPGDVVLLAGKGHETYQILKDQTIHFDDRETARRILHSLGFGKRE